MIYFKCFIYYYILPQHNNYNFELKFLKKYNFEMLGNNKVRKNWKSSERILATYSKMTKHVNNRETWRRDEMTISFWNQTTSLTSTNLSVSSVTKRASATTESTRANIIATHSAEAWIRGTGFHQFFKTKQFNMRLYL